MTVSEDVETVPTNAGGAAASAPAAPPVVTFTTSPADYRHWRLEVDGHVATATLTVSEHDGLVPGYDLKMNSYDLGVSDEVASGVLGGNAARVYAGLRPELAQGVGDADPNPDRRRLHDRAQRPSRRVRRRSGRIPEQRQALPSRVAPDQGGFQR